MPVPDQVQDDGSGIQWLNTLKRHWIPGQARNDKNRTMRGFDNYDTTLKAGVRLKVAWIFASTGMTDRHYITADGQIYENILGTTIEPNSK